MSIEYARLFIDRMKTDEDFAKQILNCENVENRMSIIKQEGFDFVAEEIPKAIGFIGANTSDGATRGSNFDCIAWSMNLQRFFR
jgi:predicted ribosomally synthesized peptide with nif11-like leader